MPPTKSQRKNKKLNGYFNFPNEFGEEGVDHINIGIQSSSPIGKLLDPSYVKIIHYPHIGKFNSVSSLWYWLKSEKLDDNYRKLSWSELKKYAKTKITKDKLVPNFKAIIAYATWLKVKQYPNILEQMAKLDGSKKLLSYHVIKTSNIRVCTSYAWFMIDIGETIIEAVKNGVEPDFDRFVSDESLSGLNYLEGFLSSMRNNSELTEMKKQEEML